MLVFWECHLPPIQVQEIWDQVLVWSSLEMVCIVQTLSLCSVLMANQITGTTSPILSATISTLLQELDQKSSLRNSLRRLTSSDKLVFQTGVILTKKEDRMPTVLTHSSSASSQINKLKMPSQKVLNKMAVTSGDGWTSWPKSQLVPLFIKSWPKTSLSNLEAPILKLVSSQLELTQSSLNGVTWTSTSGISSSMRTSPKTQNGASTSRNTPPCLS